MKEHNSGIETEQASEETEQENLQACWSEMFKIREDLTELKEDENMNEFYVEKLTILEGSVHRIIEAFHPYVRGKEAEEHQSKSSDSGDIDSIVTFPSWDDSSGNIECPHCKKTFKLVPTK